MLVPREAIDEIPVLAWSARQDGAADFFNRVWLNYTGLRMDEAIDWGWACAVHPDDLPALSVYWQTTIATGDDAEAEARLRSASGEYRWFLFRAHAVRDSSGHIARWFGTNTDIEERKRAEAALRQSEGSLRLLVDSLPALVYATDAHGRLNLANRQLIDYAGRAETRLQDWIFDEGVHEDDAFRAATQWCHSLATGEPYATEHRLRGADGMHRWFQVRGLPLRGAANTVAAWYVVLLDIDDRKRAEEAIRQSERELRQLVETVPGMIAIADSQGSQEYANRRAMEYCGAPPEDVQNLGWIGTIHPDEREMVKAEWMRCTRAGVPMDIQHRWRRFDGEYRWFHARVHPLLNPRGEVLRWYGLLTDVHDQRQAEQALRQREKQLRLIVESIPALVWSANAQGEPYAVNRRFMDYLGRQPSDDDLFQWPELIHRDDVQTSMETWIECVRTGAAYEAKYRLRGADGSYRWFQVNGAPFRDEHGQLTHWFGVAIDVDESRRNEVELQRTRDRLARAGQAAAVAELSASIAHEINQPLAAVVSNADACLTWLSNQPANLLRARASAERIIRDGHAAADVVARIRALFRQAALVRSSANLRDLATEVLEVMVDEIRRNSITVKLNLSEGIGPLLVDRVQINQVLINLIRNAIEAMQDLPLDQRSIVIAAASQDGDVLVEVTDRGSGLEDTHSIFDAFYTTKETGMGIGLAICRSIIELHGGRIWATANSDHGATFSFILPLATNGLSRP